MSNLTLIARALDALPQDFHPTRVLNPCAGNGDFGRLYREVFHWGSTLVGYENNRHYICSPAYHEWRVQHFLAAHVEKDYQLVMMVVPDVPHFGQYIAKARGCVAPGGWFVGVQGAQLLIWLNRFEAVVTP